jgi:serine/threonine-protein kinase
MYELFCGQPPFTEGDIGYHHIHTPPRAPKELNPEIPDELNKIILKCLAKAPEQRYQNAREIYLELKALER